MNNWYLYIIENKFEHFYTGISKDLKRRFAEHQTGSNKCAKALRGKQPLKMVFCCQLDNHSSALKMEIWVKKLSRNDKKLLINNQLVYDLSHQILLPESYVNE
ncbi:MAG: putative endonuclease [Paraglaciecola sp.]|jgi:putative endonuclease